MHGDISLDFKSNSTTDKNPLSDTLFQSCNGDEKCDFRALSPADENKNKFMEITKISQNNNYVYIKIFGKHEQTSILSNLRLKIKATGKIAVGSGVVWCKA